MPKISPGRNRRYTAKLTATIAPEITMTTTVVSNPPESSPASLSPTSSKGDTPQTSNTLPTPMPRSDTLAAIVRQGQSLHCRVKLMSSTVHITKHCTAGKRANRICSYKSVACQVESPDVVTLWLEAAEQKFVAPRYTHAVRRADARRVLPCLPQSPR
jgi:hypothetical protein